MEYGSKSSRRQRLVTREGVGMHQAQTHTAMSKESGVSFRPIQMVCTESSGLHIQTTVGLALLVVHTVCRQ
jgi:hypothetical protein